MIFHFASLLISFTLNVCKAQNLFAVYIAGGNPQGCASDGYGYAACFNFPTTLVADENNENSVYIADELNNAIRYINSSGYVSTFLSNIHRPQDVFFHNGMLHITSQNGIIYRVETNKTLTSVVKSNLASIVCARFDRNDDLYMVSMNTHEVYRKRSNSSNIQLFAGSRNGLTFSQDGTGSNASFDHPSYLAHDNDKNLLVSELYGYKIRSISKETAIVTTTVPHVVSPLRIVNGPDGNWYFTREPYDSISRLSKDGSVTHLFPSIKSGQIDYLTDGFPLGLSFDKMGNLWILTYASIFKIVFCPNDAVFDWAIEGCICPGNQVCSYFQISRNCPEGMEYEQKYWMCMPCKSGYYKSINDTSQCKKCPDNSKCLTNGFSCLTGYARSFDNQCVLQLMKSSSDVTAAREFSATVESYFPKTIDLSSFNNETSTISDIQSLETYDIPIISTIIATEKISRDNQYDEIASDMTTISYALTPEKQNYTFWSNPLSNILLLILAIILPAFIFMLLSLFCVVRLLRNNHNTPGKIVSQRIPDELLNSSDKLMNTNIRTTVVSNSVMTLVNTESTLATLINDPNTSALKTTPNTKLSTFTGMTTLQGSVGLSIPGFLMYNANSDFKLDKKIATGGGGSVFIGIPYANDLKKFGDKIIVKECVIRNTATSNGSDAFFQEVAIMHLLREHQNIAKLIGFSDQPYCILMKFYVMGSLKDYIVSNKNVKTKRIQMQFTQDISRGLQFMFSKGIAHCDVKTMNILLEKGHRNRNLICVITDFGLAYPVDDVNLNVKAFKVVNIVGASLMYASPEALVKFNLSFKRSVNTNYPYDPIRSDIYSLSIIMFDILTRSIKSKSKK